MLRCSHSIYIAICTLYLLTQITDPFLKVYCLKEGDATKGEKRRADHMVRYGIGKECDE